MSDLIPLACVTPGRQVFEVYTFGDGKTYEKGYTIIVDESHDEVCLDACPECGCTDIEVSAWVHANTNQVSNSEGPLDNAWCPQCEANGYESTFKARHAAKTTIEQPYQERTR